MTIEELLQSGKSKEEVMQAFEAAYDAATKANEPEPKPEPNPEPEPKPDDYLVKLTESLEKFNARLDDIEKKFSDEGNPELKPEPEARRLTDDQVNEALQKLNLLSINDKIDVNQQIEDNFVAHFGSLIGVDTKGEDKK